MASIYVDPFTSEVACSSYDPTASSGNRCGAGSFQMYPNLQDGIDGMSSGDTLYLRGGTYGFDELGGTIYNYVVLNISANGTSGNPTTITNYLNEWPILDGENNITDHSARALGVISSSHDGIEHDISYWSFIRLEIKNGVSADDDFASGMTITGNNLLFKYCYIHDNACSEDGYNPAGLRFDKVYNSIVEYCYFKDNGTSTPESYTQHNSGHIIHFTSYMSNYDDSTLVPEVGYRDQMPTTKKNEYRYNFFEGGGEGIKHKGNQMFSIRQGSFDETYNDYGDKIHHNIFLNTYGMAIRAKQDFCQVYQNIIDNCKGGIVNGFERRIYKTSVYNNTIIDLVPGGGDPHTSLFTQIRSETDWEPLFTEIDEIHADLYNNIISNCSKPGWGGFITFEQYMHTNLPTMPSYVNLDKNYFHTIDSLTDVITIAGPGTSSFQRRYFTVPEWEAFELTDLYASVGSSPTLFISSVGANKYKINATHPIESTTAATGGRGGSHPYLSGVTIPSYLGAVNPNDTAWVDGVLALDVSYMTTAEGDPTWLEGTDPGTTLTIQDSSTLQESAAIVILPDNFLFISNSISIQSSDGITLHVVSDIAIDSSEAKHEVHSLNLSPADFLIIINDSQNTQNSSNVNFETIDTSLIIEDSSTEQTDIHISLIKARGNIRIVIAITT